MITAAVHQASFGNYLVSGADFDGATQYLDRGAGLTGAVDGKQLLFSTWFIRDSLSVMSVGPEPNSGAGTFGMRLESDGSLRFRWQGGGGTPLSITTGANVWTDGLWHHSAISVDMADTAKRHWYVDGVDVLSVSTYTDTTLDFTRTNWYVGQNDGGSEDLDGGLAEYFLAFEYLDLSNASNLERLRTNTGKPAYLGANGSAVTGTTPIIYFHLNYNETADNIALNRGSGGNFTVNNGPLSLRNSSPSL